MPASEPDGDLRASSTQGYALYAASTQGTGAYCRSFGEADGLSALSERGVGVTAMSLGEANGVYAQSALGNGIHAVGGGALVTGTPRDRRASSPKEVPVMACTRPAHPATVWLP